MAKTYVAAGNTLTVEAPATLTSGDCTLVGAIFGVALTDAGSGQDVTLGVTGVWDVAKTSAQAWAVGDLIYFDGTECTNVQGTGDVLVGVAVAVAANPSATGRVRFNGDAAV